MGEVDIDSEEVEFNSYSSEFTKEIMEKIIEAAKKCGREEYIKKDNFHASKKFSFSRNNFYRYEKDIEF